MRAVLDSDAIYSRVLHELLGRVAATAQLITLLWSDELLEEAARSLVAGKELAPDIARLWVGHIVRESPGGRIDIRIVPESVDLSTLTSDPGDEHVCALASPARRSTYSPSIVDT